MAPADISAARLLNNYFGIWVDCCIDRLSGNPQKEVIIALRRNHVVNKNSHAGINKIFFISIFFFANPKIYKDKACK